MLDVSSLRAEEAPESQEAKLCSISKASVYPPSYGTYIPTHRNQMKMENSHVS